MDFDVKTSGSSFHELASELSGDVGLGLENARLPKKYLDFLSADVFGWMFRMITFEDSYARVDCLIMDFDVARGVAKSNFLVADGPSLIIKGKASLDLGKETIDMLLIPRQKQGLHVDISSVKITGPLRDPHVNTSIGKAVLAGLGGAALAPELFVPLGLIDELWKKLFERDDKGKGCTDLIAKQRKAWKESGQQPTE